jgi:phospholipid/cholesterol/gamma-HCH transport system permease protein
MVEKLLLPFSLLGRLFLDSLLWRKFSGLHIWKLLFELCSTTGEIFFLSVALARRLPKLFLNFSFTTKQMYAMGVTSMSLVLVTSIFTGGIAAWQAAYQFSNLIPIKYLGMAVCKAVTIELGPVLTALVLAGRIGSGIAAELGTMKTNEQIDAMECLALDPVRYLVIPRFVAGIVMQTVLTVYANFIAICGAYFVAINFLAAKGITSHLFLYSLRLFFNPRDVFAGLFKAAVFGGIIAMMGCYHGVNASGGAEGVGQATMKAVVASAVLILIFDFFIAALIF